MICSRFHALRVLSIILACIAGLFFPTHLLGWILALILVITIALLVFLSVQLKKKISKRVSSITSYYLISFFVMSVYKIVRLVSSESTDEEKKEFSIYSAFYSICAAGELFLFYKFSRDDDIYLDLFTWVPLYTRRENNHHSNNYLHYEMAQLRSDTRNQPRADWLHTVESETEELETEELEPEQLETEELEPEERFMTPTLTIEV